MSAEANVRCYHCGQDLGVPKVVPSVAWAEEGISDLRPPLKTIPCPRCHRVTVAARDNANG